ncbi:MAG: protein phosphatase 2C domain-containing protein [Chthoniobacteraceae bacterium]
MEPPLPGSRQNLVRLQWSGQTDRGRVRKNNEDSFLGLQFDAREVHYLGKTGAASLAAADLVFAVSDGMGGAMAGEFASRIAVDKITRLLPRAFKHSAIGMDAGVDDVLGELFQQIHKALNYLGLSDPDCAGMGATLSLAWFTPGWMFFAHVGDSRIYYLPKREGTLRQITHDDTYVGWLFRNGQINEREARNHPRRNVLQKALGAGHQYVEPQIGAVGYEPGDKFLLCTDGVVDGLFNERLQELLNTPQLADNGPTMAQKIVANAIDHSGRDNTTAVVVEIGSEVPASGIQA